MQGGILVVAGHQPHRPTEGEVDSHAVCQGRLIPGAPGGRAAGHPRTGKFYRNANPVTASSSSIAARGSLTLMVVIPSAFAGLRLMPRSSR
jgi:hypothetical protein